MTDQIGAGELGQMVDPEIGKERDSVFDWELKLEQQHTAYGGLETVKAYVLADVAVRTSNGSYGSDLIREILRGVRNDDPTRMAWAMTRMVYAIHHAGSVEAQNTAPPEAKVIHLPSEFVRTENVAALEPPVRDAESFRAEFIGGKEVVERFNFGSGTLAHRIYVKRLHGIATFYVNCTESSDERYRNNLEYYFNFLKLFGVSVMDLNSRIPSSETFEKISSWGKVEVSYSDGKMSGIWIKMPDMQEMS